MKPLPQLRAIQSQANHSTSRAEREISAVHDGDQDSGILLADAEPLVRRDVVDQRIILDHTGIHEAVQHSSSELVEVRAGHFVLRRFAQQLALFVEVILGSWKAEHQGDANGCVERRLDIQLLGVSDDHFTPRLQRFTGLDHASHADMTFAALWSGNADGLPRVALIHTRSLSL